MEYKIGKEARCAVIGYGSWATAIVGLLAANEARAIPKCSKDCSAKAATPAI